MATVNFGTYLSLQKETPCPSAVTPSSLPPACPLSLQTLPVPDHSHKRDPAPCGLPRLASRAERRVPEVRVPEVRRRCGERRCLPRFRGHAMVQRADGRTVSGLSRSRSGSFAPARRTLACTASRQTPRRARPLAPAPCRRPGRWAASAPFGALHPCRVRPEGPARDPGEEGPSTCSLSPPRGVPSADLSTHTLLSSLSPSA